MSTAIYKSLYNGRRFFDDPTQGVYFLFQGRSIVYVGQSSNIERRVFHHRQEGKKVFDSFSVIQCDPAPAALNLKEAEFIYIFQPIYNRTLPEQGEYTVLTTFVSTRGVDIRKLRKQYAEAKAGKRFWKVSELNHLFNLNTL